MQPKVPPGRVLQLKLTEPVAEGGGYQPLPLLQPDWCLRPARFRLGSVRELTYQGDQPGSRLVLYDASTKTVYNLDDMGRCGPPLRCLRPYSAEKVKLTGTFDAAKKTIKVTDVTSAK